MTNKTKEQFKVAKESYEKIGVNVNKAMETLKNIKISIHCWQGDDVQGFLNKDQKITGGIAVTGNYPGRATNPDQLRLDIKKALSLIPGRHKINLHAIYADTDEKVCISKLESKHFEKWVTWAKEQGLGLDFNPTLFSHPLASSGFTLSSYDQNIREFWIEHVKNCRKIASYMGKELGQFAINNIWIPDGYKDTPIDYMTHRNYLKNSLDTILKEKLENMEDALECKLFGIGAESYTVGSHEFYMGYAVQNSTYLCLDSGHFHPTEVVSDKLSSVSLFVKGILLHVSRPVRWDSDHVVILSDELEQIAKQLIINNMLNKTAIGLDFFDASINRVAAWVIGVRSMQIALLKALLMPISILKEAEILGDYTTRLALTEDIKTYPFGAIWNYFLETMSIQTEWLPEIKKYENEVLSQR